MNTGAIRIGNLFGRDILSTLNPNKKVRKSVFAKPIAKPEKYTDYPIMAVYPVINLGETMENYRQKVHLFNLYVEDYNAQVEIHNQNVSEFIGKRSELQIAFVDFFVKKHAKVRKYLATDHKGDYLLDESGNHIIKERLDYISENAKQYNEEVDKITAEHGYLVKKRPLQKIRKSTEAIFQQMVFMYNAQLRKRNENFMSLGVNSISRMPKMAVNSWQLSKSERDGTKALDLHGRTIKRHRSRLTEAGILVEYEFCSQKRPVKTYINSEIVSVFDLKTNKYVNTENQTVTPQIVTELPDTKGDYLNSKDEIKIKENGQADFQKGVSASLQPLLFFTRTHYQNTTEQDAELSHRAGENQTEIPKTFSQKLQETVVSDHELAERLANGEFVNYTPIDIRLLHQEAYKGTTNREEFRTIVLQDFFKTSAKLYRGKNVFFGSWLRAIEIGMSEMLVSFTGDAFNKNIIAEYVTELRWRLENARKYCLKNPEFNLLYPSLYFDPSRNTKSEGGFAYTKVLWEKHQKAIAKQDVAKVQRKINAVHRKKTLNESKIVEQKINQFIKNSITLDQLYDFVSYNYPNHLQSLAININKKSIKYNC